MEAIQALTTRRSCRSFKQEQIKDEELKTILDCGLNAPSGMNKQSSKIVVVQNQEEIKELSTKINVAQDELDQNKQNLEEEINKSNSPEYIEKVAREKLGMYLQNERVYVDSNK